MLCICLGNVMRLSKTMLVVLVGVDIELEAGYLVNWGSLGCAGSAGSREAYLESFEFLDLSLGYTVVVVGKSVLFKEGTRA